jgi:hypothetical protein
MWSNAEMDWDNEQICHWLTAVGLGEYVQVFRGMFVKLGIAFPKVFHHQSTDFRRTKLL